METWHLYVDWDAVGNMVCVGLPLEVGGDIFGPFATQAEAWEYLNSTEYSPKCVFRIAPSSEIAQTICPEMQPEPEPARPCLPAGWENVDYQTLEELPEGLWNFQGLFRDAGAPESRGIPVHPRHFRHLESVATARPRLRLRGLNGMIEGMIWEGKTLLRAGRLSSLEIVFDDDSVSRRHAEVRSTASGWRVRDLGSTNGTFLNGTRLGPGEWPLRAHDILRFGNVSVMVEMTHRPSRPRR